MPRYCSSCGTTNTDNVINCVNCGAALDIYNQSYPQNGQGYSQPYAQPYSQPYSVPNTPAAPTSTSVGGWIGWFILCSIFPLLGQLIMLTSKDRSAKNYAKAQLILIAIGIGIICLLVFGLGVPLEEILKEYSK